MIILISSAKTLSPDPLLPDTLDRRKLSKPVFKTQAEQLRQKLAEYSAKKLAAELSISLKLAEITKAYLQENEECPAIGLYNGTVCQNLDFSSYNTQQIGYLQKSLRIASGLYGILRPLDMIKPYRLEMKTSLSAVGQTCDRLWREQVSEQIRADLKGGSFLLNLASQEYIKVIAPEIPRVDVEFKIRRADGKLASPGFSTKVARGKFLNAVIMQQISSKSGLVKIRPEGYAYSAAESEKDRLVFIK